MILLFAMRLAVERRSEIGLRELLAGLYLSSFERLQRYWPEWEQMEEFVVAECGVSQPRFMYQMSVCEHLRENSKEPMVGATFDAEAGSVLQRASSLATASGDRELRIEHLLLAISSTDQNDLCRRFTATGLNTDLVQEKMRRFRTRKGNREQL